MKFRVYRYNPEIDAKPRMQEYDIEPRPGMMLRDALLEIKRQDETFAFRHSCGEGRVRLGRCQRQRHRTSLACITPWWI